MVSAVIARRSILLAPLLLTACSKRRGARPLFAAESQPADYPTTQGLYAVDRFLDETTNGEMRVRVYPGGQLGSEEATLELAVFGGVDLTRVNLGPLTSIAPLASVLALPFLFRSIFHARSVFDGPMGRTVLDSLKLTDSRLVFLRFGGSLILQYAASYPCARGYGGDEIKGAKFRYLRRNGPCIGCKPNTYSLRRGLPVSGARRS